MIDDEEVELGFSDAYNRILREQSYVGEFGIYTVDNFDKINFFKNEVTHRLMRDKGPDLFDMLSPATTSRSYYIFKNFNFIKAYSEDDSPSSVELKRRMVPIISELVTNGLISSAQEASDPYKFILHMLETRNTLPIITNTMTKNIDPPSDKSSHSFTIIDQGGNRKLSTSIVSEEDPPPGNFSLHHIDNEYGLVEKLYDIVHRWKYHSRVEASLEVPLQYSIPPKTLDTSGVWQILTRIDGVTVTGLYNYIGCTPTSHKVKKITESNKDPLEISTVEAEWSYAACLEMSRELLVKFNAESKYYTFRNVGTHDIGMSGRSRIYPNKKIPGYDSLILCIVPYENSAGVMEYTLCYLTEQELKEYFNEKMDSIVK